VVVVVNDSFVNVNVTRLSASLRNTAEQIAPRDVADRPAALPPREERPAAAACWVAHWLLSARYAARLAPRDAGFLTQRRGDAEAQKGREKRKRSLLQSVDHAMNALSHLSLAEIDDEREPEIAEAQVGESLRFEQAVVGNGRLALHDNTIVD
jgi:hypothetical protein